MFNKTGEPIIKDDICNNIVHDESDQSCVDETPLDFRLLHVVKFFTPLVE